MKTLNRISILGAMLTMLATFAPAQVHAADIITFIANMEIDNSGTNRAVYVRSTTTGTGGACGTLSGGPSGARLRWRLVEGTVTKKNYEEGFAALLSALVARTGVVLSVEQDGTECRITRIIVAQP